MQLKISKAFDVLVNLTYHKNSPDNSDENLTWWRDFFRRKFLYELFLSNEVVQKSGTKQSTCQKSESVTKFFQMEFSSLPQHQYRHDRYNSYQYLQYHHHPLSPNHLGSAKNAPERFRPIEVANNIKASVHHQFQRKFSPYQTWVNNILEVSKLRLAPLTIKIYQSDCK